MKEVTLIMRKAREFLIASFFIIISFVMNSIEVKASLSLRRCAILPITDSVQGVIGFKVYEEVEEYLKQSYWCYFKSNSELVNILQNYQANLKAHLENPQVISLVAKKLGAGSLIKIELESLTQGTDISLSVVGENGEDYYFRQRVHLKNDDIKIIAQVIKNWLEEYAKTIPYDARIAGILGNQITLDAGKESSLRLGDTLVLKRPLKKRKHPLLKEVVSWDAEIIGYAKVMGLTEQQTTAMVEEMVPQKKLEKDDWVVIDIEKRNTRKVVDQELLPDLHSHEYGKLGIFAFDFILGKGEYSIVKDQNHRKTSGLQYGLGGMVELWVTRHFWAALDVEKRFARYKREQGSMQSASQSYAMSTYQTKFGYKYLPLGFFYGPQIDFYLGYGRTSFDVDVQIADGFGDSSFSGLIFGTKANVPVMQKLRVIFGMEFILNPTYKEDVVIYGESDSTSSYKFKLGSSYAYDPQFNIDTALQISAYKAKFQPSNNIVKHKDTSLKAGMTFTF